jgi:nucleotidyltransferase substrate binding protein (TIGR01987 family)
MSTEKLILTPLEKALASLQQALAQPKNEFTRDATIQRFEYTFELCWKMLKRHLKQEAGSTEYALKDVFREAARLGLINKVESWFDYLEARNLTSHTYNEETAETTYNVAKQFAPDAVSLLEKLEEFYGSTTH